MTVELVSNVGLNVINVAASDEMVALAAWVSHDLDNDERLADKDRVGKLIRFLYRNKHMSPFEHGLFTFKVDVPFFVAREFQRHRTASYNEVSGRYTEMRPRFWVGAAARVQKGKPGDYYFVPADNDTTAVYKRSKVKAVEKAWAHYQRRLEAGMAKEQAREDLPLSMMTQFYVTMNPRNLMQFLTLRNESHALKEIQEIAVLMEAEFAKAMPLTYAVYKEERDKAEVDVEALQTQNQVLKDLVENLQKQNRELSTERNGLRTALSAKNQEYNKLSLDYNALYVKEKERVKQSEVNQIVELDEEKYESVVAEVTRRVQKMNENILGA